MYNPIIKKEEFPKFRLFMSRPIVEPGVAIVLFRENGELLTLKDGAYITAGEIAWGNFKGYYKVNTALQPFSIETSLPCNKDAFNFKANIQIIFQVLDPAEIVKNQIQDAKGYLQPELLNLMRNISRAYTSEQSEEAEQMINQTYKAGLKLGGFQITKIVVDLELDNASRDHIRRIDEINKTKAEEIAAQELQKQRDQFEIERKKIKMDFYGPLIQKGQWGMLALQLAEHPDDIKTITQILNQQRQIEYENNLKTLKIMLDNDVLEGFQLEEASKQVLKELVQGVAPVATKILTAGNASQNSSDIDNSQS